MNKRLQIYLFAIIALFSASLSGVLVTYITTVKKEKIDDKKVKYIFTTTNDLNDFKWELSVIVDIINKVPVRVNSLGDSYKNMTTTSVANMIVMIMFDVPQMTTKVQINPSDFEFADNAKLLLLMKQQLAPAHAAEAVPIYPAQQAAAPAQAAPVVSQNVMAAPGGPKIEEKKEEEPSN